MPWGARTRRAGVLAPALVAACVPGAPHLSAEPAPTDPLVIGRSVDAAVIEDERDAGPVRSTWMLSKPEAPVVATDGCHMKSIGTNGGVTTELACTVEQEFEPHARNFTQPFLGIWSVSVKDGAAIYVGILRQGVPAMGVQPLGAYDAYVRISRASDRWEGMASCRYAVASVRPVRVAGQTAYEVHGTIDVAQIIPTVEGTGVGWIDLHVEF